MRSSESVRDYIFMHGQATCAALRPGRGVVQVPCLRPAAPVSAHAHRAIAFFREFQREDGGIHQASSPTYNRGARSYYGKPTDTREMIGQLYEAHRKGPYVGREAEWARQEADIFAAQREGRVAGVYLTK